MRSIEPCPANERRASNESPAHTGPVHIGRSLAMQRSTRGVTLRLLAYDREHAGIRLSAGRRASSLPGRASAIGPKNRENPILARFVAPGPANGRYVYRGPPQGDGPRAGAGSAVCRGNACWEVEAGKGRAGDSSGGAPGPAIVHRRELPTMAISTHSSTNRALLRSTIASVLVLLALPGVPLSPDGTARADDGQGILRWDPVDEELLPIAREELKPGYVYSHFSDRLNRRVWSYLQTDGEFWYALGEGTTLKGRRLDVRAITGDRLEKLKDKHPDLAAELEEHGRILTVLYFALDGDGAWRAVSTAKHPTIYNLETGQRWERVYRKHAEPGNTWQPGPAAFLPVVHTWGSSWAVQGGKYVPAPSGCGCGMAGFDAYAPPSTTCDCAPF